ncbi:hypothetical protein BDV95DRAFT_625964 [Massariosphaeria phaeospora]|uniref:catechol O-methyltransferase n=1 Tax=Massariosphaeria phaeospora TaxID=100035 RepID=A0A7C8MJ75_9PLEO|nr:hypothetical protein BDV95DRAFT_625964 [Massariosphaeria phaeospora]
MGSFDQNKAYAPQEEGSAFFDDGREIELLHFVYSHTNLENIRGSPKNVLAAIDEYGRTKKYLMNVGEDKGRIVTDLIAEVKPKTMVELGGYVGYSCILFGDAVRDSGGQRYYSLERDPAFAAVIMSLVDLAGLSDTVKVVVGSSDESIARLHASGALEHIDLMFLDHYKPAYVTDLKLCEELRLVTPGSVLAADNVIKPGNPPYLDYVRSSVQQKRKNADEAGKGPGTEGFLETNVKMYEKRFGDAKFSQSKGNPSLVYKSKLVHSYEPTGEPSSEAECVRSSYPHIHPSHSAMLCSNSIKFHLVTKPHAPPRPAALFFYNHVPKNVLLILLSLICLPVSLALVLGSFVLVKFDYVRPQPTRRPLDYDDDPEDECSPTRPRPTRKTILVTGVSMTKGLAIARLLAQRTPHRVIGADVSPFSPGRFSTSISAFHTLTAPSGSSTKPYVDSLLSVIRDENVDLWISCSSVVAAVEDGQVVRLAEETMSRNGRIFKAIQFREDVVEKFHAKDQFIDYIESIGLQVPESYRCTTAQQVLDVLLRATPETDGEQKAGEQKEKRFILKPIGVDDRARASMMTLLPLASVPETTAYVKKLGISPSNPFQLQQHIPSPEYCTHALIVQGRVAAFTACPSSELLMHYSALSPTSHLCQQMLEFTEHVASEHGAGFTGHLSFDFLVEGEGRNVVLYPIECNPRAHTAVVLFEDEGKMADAYLSVFSRPRTKAVDVIVPKMPCPSYYWAGHDLVTLVVIPMLSLFYGRASLQDVVLGARTFADHVIYWRDGTYSVWDPWPFLVLYHVYWPVQLLLSLLNGKKWSRVNVSTTKVFES